MYHCLCWGAFYVAKKTSLKWFSPPKKNKKQTYRQSKHKTYSPHRNRNDFDLDPSQLSERKNFFLDPLSWSAKTKKNTLASRSLPKIPHFLKADYFCVSTYCHLLPDNSFFWIVRLRQQIKSTPELTPPSGWRYHRNLLAVSALAASGVPQNTIKTKQTDLSADGHRKLQQ